MTTELEQKFFKAFGINKHKIKTLDDDGILYQTRERLYPEITDRKLLQLLCIYNDMQGCIDLCIIPCKYEGIRKMILSTLVNEKLAMIDCEKGTYMDVMTKQIKQLFKEGK